MLLPTFSGYKTHTDCIEDNEDQRDRVATVLVYLDTVSEGGETSFPGKKLEGQMRLLASLL